MKIYDIVENNSPLIISVPHAGVLVPDDIAARLTVKALDLPDTDWHVDRLYTRFTQAGGATMIRANFSRYVVDLNRPPDDAPLYPGQAKVPLCPDKTFDGAPVYKDGKAPDAAEIATRLKQYWHPYHHALKEQIERAVKAHGYAVLYDAHSIRGTVPRLFDGTLPDLNLGTAKGASCAPALEDAAIEAMRKSSYSSIANGRFIGGYITRHYGDPDSNIHAMQMELAQTTYMDETTFSYDPARAANLIPVLENILNAVADNARAGVAPKPV